MRISILLMLFCVVAPSTGFGQATPPGLTEELNVNLPGFGLSFTAPKGWLRSPELAYSHLGRFVQVKEGKLAGLLEVSTTAAKGRSAKDVATKLATDRSGELMASKAAPGTESKVVEVRFPATKEFPGSAAAVMPVRDQIVIFFAGAENLNAALTTIRGMTASAAVSEPKPAADDLKLRKRPIPLFDSPVLVVLPEPFRPDAVKQPESQAFFGAHDWPSGRDEASIQVQVVPNPNGAELADVVQVMEGTLTGKLKLAKPMKFTKVNDKPTVYVSSPFATTDKESQRIMYTVLDDSRFVLLIFRSTAPDAAVRDKYMAMVEEVARTTRVSTEYQKARRGAMPAGQ